MEQLVDWQGRGALTSKYSQHAARTFESFWVILAELRPRT